MVAKVAMAAGITDKLWSLEDIAERIDSRRPQPGKRAHIKNEHHSIINL